MTEQVVAIATILLLLALWRGHYVIGDKGDKRFFSTIFSLTILGVFFGGVLNLW